MLVDKFLEEAFEVDVDCIADIGVGGDTVVIGGMLEHIEFAGCHSGDAAMVLPPHSIWPENIETMRRYTHAMARELKVAGLMNVQFAVKGKNVWVLEVNPRASRTVPFVSKAIGVPLAKLAAKVMTGKKLTELGFTKEIWPKYYSVKESVFPFSKFPGQDILLGPEMRSTGEVMGIDEDWGMAYAKSQMAAAPALPQKGQDVHQRARLGQETRRAARKRVQRAGLRAVRHRRHGGGRSGERHRGHSRSSSSTRAARTCST